MLSGRLNEGRIATFYSYKGGTGRSMALANFAWILAASGKRVLAIDWDLEAPGLHRYFRPFLIDPDLFETDGLIDTFWTFAASALARAPSAERSNESDSAKADGLIDGTIDDAKRRLNWKFPTGGYVDFVGAGRQGATYSERVNTFDWKRFYELGGARMLNLAKAHLRTNYDWVLIDSRTGVSDTAGICTMQLPDIVVTCFTFNRQSIDGVDAVMRSIRAFRSPSVDGSKIKFFPTATRIENAEKRRLEIARSYARGKLAEFLPEQALSRERSYWDDMEISYRPYYAFEEVLSAFGDATGSTRAADTMVAQMEAMAQRVTGDDSLRMPETLEIDRSQVLSKYALGSAATQSTNIVTKASYKDRVGALDEGATETEFLRGLLAKEQLWRKNKFASAYLLSRRELDLLTDGDRTQFGRSMAYYLLNSERGQRYFRNLALVFLADSVLTLSAVVTLFNYLSSLPYVINEIAAIISGIVLIMGWAGSAVFGAAFLSSDNPPYGIGFVDSFRRLFFARITSRIRDYDPDDAFA
jgi:cellulose biosynthesis protein BcsQ